MRPAQPGSPSSDASLPVRAFQWDLARQVERLDVLLKLLPRYAAWGYRELYLHLEDAVEYPSLPGVARRDAYTHRQLGLLVETASRHGIGVVPIVNLLGHTQYLIKVPSLRDLNELRALDGAPLERGQICPLHPDTLDVAEKLLRDTAPFCTTGKVHLGLDESFHLGRCPRCRAEIAAHGLPAHFAGHVGRLHTLASSHGLRMGLWADMLNFIPQAIPLLPRDVIAYDWYYYPFRRHPRIELFNFAESDLAPALRRRGIDYWGCPMNGAFRYEPLPIFRDRLANLRSWWQRCRQTRAAGFLVTSWEAYRLALETTTVVDAAAASLWLDSEIAGDDLAMLTQGFHRVFGGRLSAARSAARLALACDDHAFAGYARWEINDRWDVRAGEPPSRTHAARPRPLPPRSTPGTPLPAALTASVEFLRYLETRDAFVKHAADGIFALRKSLAQPSTSSAPHTSPQRTGPHRAQLAVLAAAARAFVTALRTGHRAARTMWIRTRDPRVRGQNEIILAADTTRLAAWRAWLRSARRDPALIFGSTPVCGRWQLTFDVVNFAPALQRVSVEQLQPDGTWLELRARHTIEFRAAAARPRTRIAQPFSTPIEDPVRPLRIVLRGLGQVRIASLSLTNGVVTLRTSASSSSSAAARSRDRRGALLGRPAPRRGFPDTTQTTGILPMNFSGLRGRPAAATA